jgi:hypothetical protein
VCAGIASTGISYRDLAEMIQERGVEVAPSTIMRWVHRYAPELEKRVRWYQGYRLSPTEESINDFALCASRITPGEIGVFDTCSLSVARNFQIVLAVERACFSIASEFTVTRPC